MPTGISRPTGVSTAKDVYVHRGDIYQQDFNLPPNPTSSPSLYRHHLQHHQHQHQQHHHQHQHHQPHHQHQHQYQQHQQQHYHHQPSHQHIHHQSSFQLEAELDNDDELLTRLNFLNLDRHTDNSYFEDEADTEVCNILNSSFEDREERRDKALASLRQKTTTPTTIRFASYDLEEEEIEEDANGLSNKAAPLVAARTATTRPRNGSTPTPPPLPLPKEHRVSTPSKNKSNPNSPITTSNSTSRSYSIKELQEQLQHVPLKTRDEGETEEGGRATPPGIHALRGSPTMRARLKSPARDLLSKQRNYPIAPPSQSPYARKNMAVDSHEWLQSNQRKEQQQQLQNNLHQLSALFNNNNASFFHFQVTDSIPSSPPSTPSNTFFQPQQPTLFQQSHSQYQQQQQQQHFHQHSQFGTAIGSRSGVGQNNQPIGARSAPQPPIGSYPSASQTKYSVQPFYPASHSKQTPPNSLSDYDHPISSQHNYTPPTLSPLMSPPVIDHYFNQSQSTHEQAPTIQQQYHQLQIQQQIQLQIQQQKERQEKQNQLQAQSQLKSQPQIQIKSPQSQLQSQLQSQPLPIQHQLQPQQQASPQPENLLTKSPSSPNQSRLRPTSPQNRRASLGSDQLINTRPNHFGSLTPPTSQPWTAPMQHTNRPSQLPSHQQFKQTPPLPTSSAQQIPKQSPQGSPNSSPGIGRRNSLNPSQPAPSISVTPASYPLSSNQAASSFAVPTAPSPAQAIPAPNDALLHPNSNNKRNELSLSPTTKLKFKAFFRQFKLKEKEGFQAAKDFALSSLSLLPEKIHWKVYLQMADLAKRENLLREAHRYYKKVNKLQPYASQGWLEHAKMEEECGDLEKCRRILATGLTYCTYNENLMVKAIKLEERIGNLTGARLFLARLKNVSIDQTWRTILEGGLLEARVGNIQVARRVFKYLMKNVPWYGPIYYEAFRFEEKCEEYQRAIEIVEKGLKENPHYGPLWFSALRLYEKTSNGNLEKTRETVERAKNAISKELTWKLYFEAAQIEDRAGNLELSRKAYVQSVYHCQENLLWKVWLGGARTELNNNNLMTARKLLKRSFLEVPLKMRAMVLLECSRLEEYAGYVDRARKILKKARIEAKHEWKVFLESVLLEMRANNIKAAIKEAQEALEVHRGTGRLWAVLIQLKQIEGEEQQLSVFQEALNEVPKSGEVWCEGARIALNKGNFAEARKFLDFAIQFTPQYGDSFIEYLRLELVENGCDADTSKLEQLCINADPNYGSMWLYCKRHPLDSTRQVLRVARQTLLEELGLVKPSLTLNYPKQDIKPSPSGGNNSPFIFSQRYLREEEARSRGTDEEEEEDEDEDEEYAEVFEEDEEDTDDENFFDEYFEGLMIHRLSPNPGSAYSKSRMGSRSRRSKNSSSSSSLSSSFELKRGLLYLNQVCQHIHELSDEERRRAIYGSDQIKP
eukprot:TRINITY_DN5718_c0_g3_i1.p1 TRINITY_DN5718_c0_g3~~TRINITY_DN5718_c0_g3_i1.p1  ORF type:complete len:1434 (-),score=333.17 TRINITY_DN5718_c0_g3_i1:126-4427(-)